MPRFEQIGLTSIVVAQDGKTQIKAVVPSTRTFEEWCDYGLIERAQEVRDALLNHLRDLNGAERPDFFTSFGIQIPVINDGMRRIRADVMKYLATIDEILEQSARVFHEGLKLRIDDLRHGIDKANREMLQILRERPELERMLSDKKAEIQETAHRVFGPKRERLFEERSRLQLAVQCGFSREEFLKNLLNNKRRELEETRRKSQKDNR